MPIYSLIFKNHEDAVEKTMEFEGQTAIGSFGLIEANPDAHHVELWTGGEKLAEMKRGPLGLWRVDAKRPTSAERDWLLKKDPT